MNPDGAFTRISKLSVTNYRSIGSPVEITFPLGKPVVLMGENNAGKSNLLSALNLVLGPTWPSSHEPEDHEFFGRDRKKKIEIEVSFDDDHPLGERYGRLRWSYDSDRDEACEFRGYSSHKGGGYTGYVRNEDRDTCVCAYISAERDLSYHLSYRTKWTFLSRLMHRFHRAMVERPDVRGQLESLFADVKDTFERVPEFERFASGLQKELSNLVSSMTHVLEVDFEAYNPVNFFHALRLQAKEGANIRTLEEMGTGERQILALAFAHSFVKAFHAGVVLAIEEPEAHLHPLAQQWLGNRLRAMASDGLQIIVTTHSPAFVYVADLEGLVLVRKDPVSGTAIRQITKDELCRHCVESGASASRVTVANVLPFYASSATRRIMEGFFAKAVVLVEGPTEAFALPIYLRRRGLDTLREGVAIVPVHGKGSLGKWYRLFTAYELPTFIVFDNDGRSDDKTGDKRRDALRSVGVAPADVDEVLGEQELVIGRSFAVFGTDFEVTLRELFPDYVDAEAAAFAQGINSKPFVAQYAARIVSDNPCLGWERIDALRDALLLLTEPLTGAAV